MFLSKAPNIPSHFAGHAAVQILKQFTCIYVVWGPGLAFSRGVLLQRHGGAISGTDEIPQGSSDEGCHVILLHRVPRPAPASARDQ